MPRRPGLWKNDSGRTPVPPVSCIIVTTACSMGATNWLVAHGGTPPMPTPSLGSRVLTPLTGVAVLVAIVLGVSRLYRASQTSDYRYYREMADYHAKSERRYR